MLLYRIFIKYKPNSKYQFSCILCHDFYKLNLDKGCVLSTRYYFLKNKPVMMKFPDGKCIFKILNNCYQFMPPQSYPVIDGLLYKLLL